jgi:hypothetical protein
LIKRLGYTRYVPQGGDWVPSSSTRWACRRLRDCSRSTPTCLASCRPKSTRLPWRATQRKPDEEQLLDRVGAQCRGGRHHCATVGGCAVLWAGLIAMGIGSTPAVAAAMTLALEPVVWLLLA